VEASVSRTAVMTGVPGICGKATMDQAMIGEPEVGSDGTVLTRIRRLSSVGNISVYTRLGSNHVWTIR
jgi:hypothetical protein